MLNKQLTNIYLLNTAKHKGLIKILVTGSLVLYSFIASQAYSIYQYKNINLNEYNTGLTVTRILIKELCLTVLSEYILPNTTQCKTLNLTKSRKVAVVYLYLTSL